MEDRKLIFQMFTKGFFPVSIDVFFCCFCNWVSYNCCTDISRSATEKARYVQKEKGKKTRPVTLDLRRSQNVLFLHQKRGARKVQRAQKTYTSKNMLCKIGFLCSTSSNCRVQHALWFRNVLILRVQPCIALWTFLELACAKWCDLFSMSSYRRV